MSPTILEVPNPHLYVGLSGRVLGPLPTGTPPVGTSIAFNDGSMAAANLQCEHELWLLQVQSYISGSGNTIVARNWVIAFTRINPSQVEFKILRKA
jgi:hypothetical protein